MEAQPLIARQNEFCLIVAHADRLLRSRHLFHDNLSCFAAVDSSIPIGLAISFRPHCPQRSAARILLNGTQDFHMITANSPQDSTVCFDQPGNRRNRLAMAIHFKVSRLQRLNIQPNF